MNKLILMLMLLTSASFSEATEGIDSDPCECEEISTEYTIQKVLCEYHGLDNFGDPVDNPRALWIELRYTVAICGSVTQVRVNSFTVHTALGNYVNAGYPMGSNSTPCNPPDEMADPNDPIAWQAWVKHWTNVLLSPIMTTPTVNNYIVMYPAGCMSIMKVKWKEGSIYYPGEGGTTIEIPMGGVESYLMVPCTTTECCIMEVVNHAPGQITYNLINENVCDNAEPDDEYIPQLTTYDPLDPETPIIIEVDEILEFIRECRPMCMIEEPSFTTDLNEVQGKQPLIFSANPTLVHDFIKFTSNVPITKIEVYSIQGKKAIDIMPETKELNTSELKTGIYFMRVYFANKELKTIKIQKQ